MTPQNDPAPGMPPDDPAPGARPEVANSQPAIADGRPVLWWEHPIDLNARALIREALDQVTLDWAHSVQDLLALAGQDHSAEARRWMARVLQWPGATPDDPAAMSAEMNAWLCTRLKVELVKHGSKMPQPQG